MNQQPRKGRSMKTKGQTSLDFLMTYGWAVLLVVVVVASLFALGIFNAGSFMGPRATGFSQIGVIAWNVNAAGVLALRMQNYAGMDVSIISVEATHGPSVYLYDITNVSIPNGKTSETFTVGAITSLVSGQYYTLPLKIMYTDFNGFNYTETGTISGTVGAGVVPPLLMINSPSSNSVITNRTINISVTVWGANLSYTDIMVIDSSGAPVNVTTNSQLGTYSVLLDVQTDGVYNITAMAHYSDGGSVSATARNITVNTTAQLGACGTGSAAGMVSYWKFDESSGTTASDRMDANPGTLVNGPAWAAGKVGGALQFYANQSYITIPDSQTLDGNGNFAIEMWVNPQSTGDWQGLFFKGASSPYHYAFALDSSGTPSFYSDVNYWMYANTTLSYGTWSHLAVVFDGADINFLVNGAPAGSSPITVGVSNMPLVMGMWDSNYGQLNGLIDEVAVYNRSLTTDEIHQHYEAGLSGQGYCAAAPSSPALSFVPPTPENGATINAGYIKVNTITNESDTNFRNYTYYLYNSTDLVNTNKVYKEDFSVAGGVAFTCFLKQNGNVECQGANDHGQSDNYAGNDAIQVAPGYWHTCFLKQDGSVECQGDNSFGQSNPYAGNDAIAIAVGSWHTCFLKQDGSVQCQGDNSNGESNNYDGHDVVSISAGYRKTCFLKQDGSVECQGYNAFSGYGGNDAIGISVGDDHACFLKQDGSVECQGDNTYGESNPYAGNDVIQVSVGAYFYTCFLKQNGSVQCQGYSSADYEYAGTDVIAISAGYNHVCFLKQDGSVQCQGTNDQGQANNYTGNDIKKTAFYAFQFLDDGIYYLNATACDTSGNCGSTETRTLTVNSTASLEACGTGSTAGIVSYWKAEGDTSDAVNGNDGTPDGGVSYAAGPVGQAFGFSNGYVLADVPQISTSPGDNTTVEFWVYWDGSESSGPMPIAFYGAGYDLHLYWGWFGFNTWNGDIYGVSSAGLANRWVHVAAVFNNGDVLLDRLFIDGVEQSLSEVPGGNPSHWSNSVANTLSIGGHGASQYFGGMIDEVAIFNRSLTADEVRQQYQLSFNGQGYCAPVAHLATPLSDCGNISYSVNYVLTGDVGNSGTCFTIEADNVTLDCDGHTITGSGPGNGIYNDGHSYVTVKNCVVTGFDGGISFGNGASHGTITNNTARANTYNIGVSGSDHNTIINNTAGPGGYIGIILSGGSSYNLIADNHASGNGMGIHFNSCSDNMISDNTVDSNGYGIYLYVSPSNIVANNTVSLNSDFGLAPGASNAIYNNILNNTVNAVMGAGNAWNTTLDCGTPNIVGGNCTGGNYWANPSGTGFSQTCADADSDGICDSSFNYDCSNIDSLPLSTVGGAQNATPGLSCSAAITENITLDSNLTCTSTAINICTDDVTVDCNGYTIAGGGYGFGIFAGGDNVTVKNCNITGFQTGINFEGGSYGAIENNTISSGSDNGVRLSSGSSSIIANNTLSSNGNSIGIWSSNNNTIANNTAVDSGAGIAVFSSMYNLITNNDFSRDGFSGIHFNGCSNNTIANNTIDSNNYGAYLYASAYSTVANNTFSNNSGFGLAPSSSAIMYNNIFNNTVNVAPGTSNVWNTTLDCSVPGANIIRGDCIGGNFWANPSGAGFSQTCADSNTTDGICDSSFNYDCSNIDSLPLAAAGAEQNPVPLLGCGAAITENTTLDANLTCASTAINICTGNVTLDCDGHTIAGSNSGSGVFAGSDHVTVRNCNITGFQTGISFEGAGNGTIENNTVTSNSASGINLVGSDCVIANNTVSLDGSSGIGVSGGSNNTIIGNTAGPGSYIGIILFAGSHDNLITGNNASGNGMGIHFNSCFDNLVSNNTVDSNGYGIYLYASTSNTVANNMVRWNSDFGLAPSESGTVYNNFLNNSLNAIPGSSGIWNTTLDCGTMNIIGGQCIGGNFWAQPDGNGWSENATECNANSSGICTSPYVIDGSNVDELPLTNLIPLSCVQPPSGLVAWWPGDNNASDIIGGNDGTLNGGATYAPGMVGQALSFDGLDGYVESPSNGVPIGSSARSVAFWFKLNSFTDTGGYGNNILFQYGATYGNIYSWLLPNGTGNKLYFMNGGGDWSTSWGAPTLGQWYFFTSTYDGSQLTFYIDGVFQDSYLYALTTDPSDVYIGAGPNIPWPGYVNGTIDEVQIYDRALNDSEIQAIYDAGSYGMCRP